MLLWGSWEHLRLMAWPQNWNCLGLILLQGIKLGNHYAGNKGQVLLLDWINHKAKWCGSSVSKTRWKWGWVWGASASFCRWRVLCLFFSSFCFTWELLFSVYFSFISVTLVHTLAAEPGVLGSGSSLGCCSAKLTCVLTLFSRSSCR